MVLAALSSVRVTMVEEGRFVDGETYHGGVDMAYIKADLPGDPTFVLLPKEFWPPASRGLWPRFFAQSYSVEGGVYGASGLCDM